MRTLIVHNPRSGFNSDAIFEFERALLDAGDECVFRMLAEDEILSTTLTDAESFDLIVVSGGDGTVAHALYALRYRQVPVLVFPSGTANLIAANIGNANEPHALAAACKAGKVVHCDLGEARWTDSAGTNWQLGLALMGGSGFDAQLMHNAIPAKDLLGEAAYFAAALGNLRPSFTTFTVEVDGVAHHHRGISCLVTNNAMMQGEIEIVPGSSMTDGLIDVAVLESRSSTGLLKPIVAGIMDPTGTEVGRPEIAWYRGKHISVHSEEPLRMEIDGDVIGTDATDWEVQVLPRCVPVIVDQYSRYTS